MPLAFTRGKPRPRRWNSAPLCVAGGHRHRRVARNRRNAQLGAKHELRVRDEHLGVEIFAVALEARIVGDLEQHVNVAARPASRSRVADAAQRHVLARRYARRNLDRDLALAAQSSFATTFLARRLNDASFAVTGGARRRR